MFNIHDDRELVLLKYLHLECTYCSFILDCDEKINKINGILSSLYMLDIIDEPIIILNYYEVNELKNSIEKYMLEIYKGDKKHERK